MGYGDCTVNHGNYVAQLDHELGRVLHALDNGPHAENTIVVLFSDHGYHLGDRDFWGKFTLWEEATRAPLFFVAPVWASPACSRPDPSTS